jgi:cellulose synthase/poly-beta-1,6-N-acetylglucosamine synthase-like glycosyltransferase
MTFIDWMVWCILGYFIVSHGGYLLLNLRALSGMRRIEQAKVLADLPHIHSGLEPPISMLLTTRNEASGIVASVRSMLALNYPQLEVIVVNDGSEDGTMAVLTETFDLLPFPEAYRIQLPTQAVARIYRSTRHPNLRVLDKTGGGRADALNAGVNAARYPLVCTVDRHAVLHRDGLRGMVMPFLENANTIATAGAIRLSENSASGNRLLSRLQIAASLRTELFATLGWSALNALLIAPPGIQLLRKEAVIEARGYRTDALAEELDLILRLHRLMQDKRQPYQIKFVGDGIGWREPLDNLSALKTESMLRQQVLSDSMRKNIALLSGRSSHPAIRLAFLSLMLFEWAGPLIEAFSYLFIAIAFMTGAIAPAACAAFFSVAIGMGILLSVSSLLLEEISFRSYQEPDRIGKLMAAAVIDNLGFRQVNAYWRSLGQIQRILRIGPNNRPAEAARHPAL